MATVREHLRKPIRASTFCVSDGDRGTPAGRHPVYGTVTAISRKEDRVIGSPASTAGRNNRSKRLYGATLNIHAFELTERKECDTAAVWRPERQFAILGSLQGSRGSRTERS